MKTETEAVVCEIVEAMLPRFSENKLLHICVDARYLCFPRAYKNGNDCSDEINESTYVHFVFYRPSSYTKVLLLESKSLFLEETDVFEMTSDHDSCWRSDGVGSELSKIHWRLIEKVEEQCKALGEEPPPCLRVDQPNFCSLQTIEILQGKTDGVNYGNRKCQMIKDGDEYIFLAE